MIDVPMAPPVMSVPAERGVSESLRSGWSFTKRTSASMSSASLGKTTMRGRISKMLASWEYSARVLPSSATSPLMTAEICSLRFMASAAQDDPDEHAEQHAVDAIFADGLEHSDLDAQQGDRDDGGDRGQSQKRRLGHRRSGGARQDRNGLQTDDAGVIQHPQLLIRYSHQTAVAAFEDGVAMRVVPAFERLLRLPLHEDERRCGEAEEGQDDDEEVGHITSRVPL